eukprot:6203019-Pleurochrysis_carterae.AAC.2
MHACPFAKRGNVAAQKLAMSPGHMAEHPQLTPGFDSVLSDDGNLDAAMDFQLCIKLHINLLCGPHIEPPQRLCPRFLIAILVGRLCGSICSGARAELEHRLLERDGGLEQLAGRAVKTLRDEPTVRLLASNRAHTDVGEMRAKTAREKGARRGAREAGRAARPVKAWRGQAVQTKRRRRLERRDRDPPTPMQMPCKKPPELELPF